MAKKTKQTVEPRGYIDRALKEGIGAIQSLRNNKRRNALYDTHYKGERIAPFSPDQLAAMYGIRSAQGQWMPWLAQAGQTAQGAQQALQRANQEWPDAYKRYTNPYEEAVVSQIGKNAQRRLKEDLLPALNDQFIGAGQFSSSRHDDFLKRTVRDVSEQAAEEEAKLRQSGWSQNAGIFAEDQRRAQAGAGGNTDLARLYAQLGGQQQQQAYQDASQLGRSGGVQQGQTQQQLDKIYGDWQYDRDYPWQKNFDYLSAVRGAAPVAGGTTTNSQPGSSPWTQAIGLGLGAIGTLGQAGAFGPGGWFARGGRVRKKTMKKDMSHGGRA